jgi:hypothetical protein
VANGEPAIERIFEPLPDAVKHVMIRKKMHFGRVGKRVEKACKILMLMEILGIAGNQNIAPHTGNCSMGYESKFCGSAHRGKLELIRSANHSGNRISDLGDQYWLNCNEWSSEALNPSGKWTLSCAR